MIKSLLRVPNLLTWLSLVVISVGFVLIAIAWGRTAGLTNVGLQMPYLISAGFTGLALVAVGATGVAADARLRDAADRRQQSRALTDAILDALGERSTADGADR